MTPDEALEFIEQAIAPKQLNKIQQIVFLQTWRGLSYIEIAKTTGYDLGYIKDSGYQLWRLLSGCLGRKIAKQNVQAVFPIWSGRGQLYSVPTEPYWQV